MEVQKAGVAASGGEAAAAAGGEAQRRLVLQLCGTEQQLESPKRSYKRLAMPGNPMHAMKHHLTAKRVNTTEIPKALARRFALPKSGALGPLLRRKDCFCISPEETAARAPE